MQRIPGQRHGAAALGFVLALTMLVLSPSVAALAPVDDGAGGAPAEPKPIDINTATEEEFSRLPGIGATIARRIVEFREEYGPFRKVEDLLKVKGIGEKSFQKLRSAITVSDPR